MKKMKNRKGITLIALVVTIIVILILAGITVGMVTSDNGILRETKSAKLQAEIDNEKSIVERATMLSMMRSKKEGPTTEIFKQALAEEAGNNKTEVIENNDLKIVRFIETERCYEVDLDWNVKEYDVKIDKNPGDIKKGINGETLDGTKEKPFEIWCIEDLVEWSKNYSEYESNYINLCTDLDFKFKLSYKDAYTIENGDINGDGKVNDLMTELTTGTGFTPIESFKGTFNGNDFEISNIYINATDKDTGFISSIEDATIKRIIISGNVTGSKVDAKRMSVGGIIGISEGNSIIENCVNKAKVTGNEIGSYGTGGIIGYFEGDKIDSCINYGNIISEGICGGIVGTSPSPIYNCINFGNVLAKDMSAAGINGGDYWSDTPKMYNCINKGNVETTKSDIYSSSGGIYGYMRNALSSLDMYNSCNIGKLTSKYSTGGLIAAIREITPTIKNCYYLKTERNEILGTPYTEDQMKSEELLNNLNSFIENNADGIDTTGYAKWIKEEDEYPTLDFKTIWNGSEWIVKKD